MALRVAFVGYDSPGHLGGIESWMYRVLPRLRAFDIEPSVLLVRFGPESRGVVYQTVTGLGIPCDTTPMMSGIESTHWLLGRLSRSPVDVVVPQHVAVGYMVTPYARRAGIKVLAAIHNTHGMERFIYHNFVAGPPSHRVDGVVGVSEAVREFLELDRAPVPIHETILNGVTMPETLATPPGETLRLAYMGRLEEVGKKITRVAEAFCAATTAVPGTEAVFVGEGTGHAKVEAMLEADPACAARVSMLGRLPYDQVQREYNRSHAICLLSDYEGLPMVLLEGMATGLVPIVPSWAGGFAELVEQDVNGFRVGDTDEFVAAVRRLRTEPGLWPRMSAASREIVAERYSLDQCVRRWAAVLHRLRPEFPVRPELLNPAPDDLASQFGSLNKPEVFDLSRLYARDLIALLRQHKQMNPQDPGS